MRLSGSSGPDRPTPGNSNALYLHKAYFHTQCKGLAAHVVLGPSPSGGPGALESRLFSLHIITRFLCRR